MKRYLVPGIVITLLLFLMGSALSLYMTDSPSASGSPKKSLLKPVIDHTTIDFKTVNVTSGPKAPVWGVIRQVTQPKIEETSFHNNKVATAAQGVQKKADQKKKKKKDSKKKKKKADKRKAVRKPAPAPNSDSGLGQSQQEVYFGADLLANKIKKDKPVTAEEWFLAISDPENRDKLYELIKLHQAGLVTDKVFYDVGEKLLASESDNLNRFGLLAMGSFMSIKSFELTADYVGQEGNSSLRAMALGNLDVYQSTGSLGLLRSLLSSATDSARYYSASLMGGSAQLNLRPAQPVTPGGTAPGRGGRDGSSTIQIQTYQSLLPLLENVGASDANSDVRSAALRSHEIIRGLIPAPFVAISN